MDKTLPDEPFSARPSPKEIGPDDLGKYLPHRHPTRMVDRIIDHEPGLWAIGSHAVSIVEPCFQGHYPDNPIYSATAMLEAMLQVGCFILSSGRNMTTLEQQKILDTGVERLRFLRVVRPGDVILFYCKKEADEMGLSKISGYGSVNGEKCISGKMVFAIPE